jgi:hypothetical protein
MKPEIRDRWTAALRSGEYEQGCLYLLNHNKYCCLGVLNDLYAKDTEGAVWASISDMHPWFPEDTPENPEHLVVNNERLLNFIPLSIAEWAGFTEEDFEALTPPSPGHPATLNTMSWAFVNMNDRDHKTFAEIADVIEGKL